MSTIFLGQELPLGNAEIWIPDGAGGIFAAPNLIVHYIETHNYLPPSEFIEAVFNPLPEDWDAAETADRLIQSNFTN